MDETDLPPNNDARGCVTLVAIFLVVAFAGALATMALYVLVVEQWGLIAVRREFGFDMIIYAPLTGIACGFAATFWATRGGGLASRAPVVLGLGLIVALGLMVFFGLGTVL